jgi:hypothetical protein
VVWYQVRADDVELRASPIGWHDTGAERYTTTVGNNVCAHDNPSNNPARSSRDPPPASLPLS